MGKAPRLLEFHLSDGLCLAALLFLAVMARPLVMSADPFDWVLAFVLLVGGLRILFEVTINRHRVPTMASGYFAQRAMIEALIKHANGKQGYHVIDLGSGRGGFARRIARALPSARVTGIELAAIPHAWSVCVRRMFGPGNVSYERADFMQCDCALADAVVMFLDEKGADTIGQKLRREMRTGAMIISNHFPLSADWVPTEVMKPPYSFDVSVYVYVV